MNKLLLFLLYILGINFFLVAQKPFQDIPFEKALQKAKKEKKLIFLQYESEECSRCNEVADKAFLDKALSDKISKEFIAIKISPTNKHRTHLMEDFELGEKAFGTLFISAGGEPVYRYWKTSSRPQDYFETIDSVYKKLKYMSDVEAMEEKYFNSKEKKVQDLKKLIETKTILNQKTELLLTEYINLIPKDSLKSVNTVRFLLLQSPPLDSKPYKQIVSDRQIYTAAWRSIEPKNHIIFNNRIIQKSLDIAIAERDEQYAIRTAKYAADIAKDELADLRYNQYMSRYYQRTFDTSKYLPAAMIYYNQYAKTFASEDFIERWDSLARKNAFANKKLISETPTDNGKVLRKYVIPGYKKPATQIANALNYGTWSIYKMDLKNAYTQKALELAKRSVDISENGDNLDTYARLLYKAGKAGEAVKMEEKAITVSKKTGSERKEWYPVLEKMKAGLPLE